MANWRRPLGRCDSHTKRTANAGYHLALSVVGTERLLESGYFRAKMAQENLIRASGIPYTTLHSTQFFEFVDGGANGDVIRLSPALVQPIAADDVAAALADLALGPPVNGIVEVAGPEQSPLDQLASIAMAVKHDQRRMIADTSARYYGALLDDRSLTPGDRPLIGRTRFEAWLNHSMAA